MANHRLRSVRTRVATAIGVILALTAGFFALAPSAFAHHTTIGGTTSCSTDNALINVDWTASSWGSANQSQYYNPNVKVQYAVNGGAYTDVPSGSPGSFSANHLSFTGSFTVPNTTTSLALKTIDVGTWGDGVAGGSKVATANVALPNPKCEPKGSLTIKKATTGDAAPAPGTDFTFNVTGPQNFTLTAKSGDANGATRGNLPYGTYTIAEQSPPAGGVTYDPSDVAVLGANSKTVTVTATNAYRDYAGSLTFTKVVTGDLAQNGVIYTINYDGPDDNDGSVQLKAGETTTVNDLPRGSYAISETNAPDGVVITPNPAVIGQDAEDVKVTVTNPYPGGYLEVTKHVTGAAAPAPGTQYTVHYDGPGNNDGDIVVTAGQPTKVGPLPLGLYNLSEVDAPVGATIVPSAVNLTVNAQTATVDVTNPFPGGYLDVSKVETGKLAPGGTYTIDYAGPTSGTVQVTAGAAASVVGPLPLGTYTLTEAGTNPGHIIQGSPAVLGQDNQHAQVVATNPFGDPSASIDPSCAKGVVVTLSNGALDGPDAVFSIKVDGVEVQSGINVAPNSSKDVPVDTLGKAAKVEVFAQQGQRSVLVDTFDEWAFNCPPSAGSFIPDCADGAYSVLLTNDAAVPVEATLTKNGKDVGTVTVPANGSLKALVAMNEDETATLAVRYGNEVIAEKEVTLDCVAPLTPTTAGGGATVLGATQTRGSLPVTGSNTAPIGWTALLLILTGGLAVGAGMRIRRRSEG